LCIESRAGRDIETDIGIGVKILVVLNFIKLFLLENFEN
jgi:hypothetical protein